jgi:NAD(P)-dependent dehydrogenase (short-subunit alcohol dehydrogenase family)
MLRASGTIFSAALLAQAVEEVFRVLCALERIESLTGAVNRPPGADPRDLSGFCPALFHVSQLDIGRGQPGHDGVEAGALVDDILETAVEAFGQVDVLVNNAGTSQRGPASACPHLALVPTA